jgi:NADH dehydrogenase (ubiquinone) 1 beta subcomplex subunit 10
MAADLPEYERVPGLDEIDPKDFVALKKARDQLVRDRAVDLEEVKILRERVRDCVRREEVNHPQRCREHVDAYFKAFRKYKSEGWYAYH